MSHACFIKLRVAYPDDFELCPWIYSETLVYLTFEQDLAFCLKHYTDTTTVTDDSLSLFFSVWLLLMEYSNECQIEFISKCLNIIIHILFYHHHLSYYY